VPAGEHSVIINNDGAPGSVVDDYDIVVVVRSRCRCFRLFNRRGIFCRVWMRPLRRYYLGYRFALLPAGLAIDLGRRSLLRLGWNLDFPSRNALDGLVFEGFLAGGGSALLILMGSEWGLTLLEWRPRR
jgi:hypothetical protein